MILFSSSTTSVDATLRSTVCVSPQSRQIHAKLVSPSIDEACINFSRARKATREQQSREGLVRVYHPHIAALLAAVAQETYEGPREPCNYKPPLLSRGLRSATEAQKASVVLSEKLDHV